MTRTAHWPLIVLVLAIAAVASPATAWGKRMEISMEVPAGVAPGETFDVPVSVSGAARGLMSYALRLQYDPKVLKVVAVQGGTFDGFAGTPITNPAVFESGLVDFTANNSGFMATPTSLTIATIKLTAVGSLGQETQLKLRVTPRNNLIDGRFRRVLPGFPRRSSRITLK